MKLHHVHGRYPLFKARELGQPIGNQPPPRAAERLDGRDQRSGMGQRLRDFGGCDIQMFGQHIQCRARCIRHVAGRVEKAIDIMDTGILRADHALALPSRLDNRRVRLALDRKAIEDTVRVEARGRFTRAASSSARSVTRPRPPRCPKDAVPKTCGLAVGRTG